MAHSKDIKALLFNKNIIFVTIIKHSTQQA